LLEEFHHVALYLRAVLAQGGPWAFGEIVRGAFAPDALYGGVLGVLVVGFQRAAFSNEAGIGSGGGAPHPAPPGGGWGGAPAPPRAGRGGGPPGAPPRPPPPAAPPAPPPPPPPPPPNPPDSRNSGGSDDLVEPADGGALTGVAEGLEFVVPGLAQ
jgi:hypothetical protein